MLGKKTSLWLWFIPVYCQRELCLSVPSLIFWVNEALCNMWTFSWGWQCVLLFFKWRTVPHYTAEITNINVTYWIMCCGVSSHELNPSMSGIGLMSISPVGTWGCICIFDIFRFIWVSLDLQVRDVVAAVRAMCFDHLQNLVPQSSGCAMSWKRGCWTCSVGKEGREKFTGLKEANAVVSLGAPC